MKMFMLAVLLLMVPVAGAQVWQEVVVDGFTLNWATVIGDMLSVKLSAPTTGWLSVGFDPTQQMLDANIIIGYVESATPFLRDDFGWQATSHRADTLLGGTNDVTIDGGTEAGGTTQIEFTIPLDSGDPKDRELIVGNLYTVIFARSGDGEDNFSAPHAVTSSAQIEISALALEANTWASVKATIW